MKQLLKKYFKKNHPTFLLRYLSMKWSVRGLLGGTHDNYHRDDYIGELRTTGERLQVKSGPFSGMSYLTHALGSSLAPKIIGSYECELHKILYAIKDLPYKKVYDVGSAEGYYAVGLAYATSHLDINAYDLSKSARIACRDLAELNNVTDRVTVKKRFHWIELNQVQWGDSILIFDVEGWEFVYLKEKYISKLHHSIVIVELHEFIIDDLIERLKKNAPSLFRKHHLISFDPNLRKQNYPEYTKQQTDERRPEVMKWLVSYID